MQRKTMSKTTFKDVQIAYLCGGIDPIEKLYQQKRTSLFTIKRAMIKLKNKGFKALELEQFYKENRIVKKRGRIGPKVGQGRVYLAQQINESEAFLRLPLKLLNIDKGNYVSVVFEEDKITVKAI